MSTGIEIEGFEELEELVQEMTIDEADEIKAMKKAIEPIYDAVYNAAPKAKGRLKKGVKKQVKKDGFGTVGIVKLSAWHSMFIEFGTSRNKSHIGFFDRAVGRSKNEAIEILSKELLDKIK